MTGGVSASRAAGCEFESNQVKIIMKNRMGGGHFSWHRRIKFDEHISHTYMCSIRFF